jgi:redox-sensitive bicupin YhaK (pirin superfamily)
MERPIARVESPARRGTADALHRHETVIGHDDYAATTPFLSLSEDWFSAPAGFPTHPHRGMQTVTFVVDGALAHRDHTGGNAVLRAGDVQWMTAGRGVLHSELPYRDEQAHTLQLWLNLPARLKMIPARYVDQRRAEVPVRRLDGVAVRVYGGSSGAIRQPHGSDWPLTFLDIAATGACEFAQEIAAADRCFVYVLAGSARLGADRRSVAAGEIAWFDPAAADAPLPIESEAPFRALLFASPPIDEPVATGGPFVMNTAAEIEQAFADYRSGRFVT